MVIEACRAMLTERFRLMCKQRGRQHPIGPGTTEELKRGEELKHAEQRFFREIGECVRYWQGIEQVEDTDAT
jgi:hypothetical protein